MSKLFRTASICGDVLSHALCAGRALWKYASIMKVAIKHNPYLLCANINVLFTDCFRKLVLVANFSICCRSRDDGNLLGATF